MNTSDTTTRCKSDHLCSLDIIGGFLDGQQAEVADDLNCIIGIGGLGKTGRTTVVESIRDESNSQIDLIDSTESQRAAAAARVSAPAFGRRATFCAPFSRSGLTWAYLAVSM